MSYSTTENVEEGQIVTATIFQQIKDNIYAIYDVLGTDQIIDACAFNAEHSIHGVDVEGSFLTIFHTFRYLAYGSTGEIIDPTELNPPVSISDPAEGIGYYDLDNISWLAYGMVYRVEGVTWCREVEFI